MAKKLKAKEIAIVEQGYQSLLLTASQFMSEVKRQIEHLLKQNKIPLGVPIEVRIKEWESVREKIERHPKQFKIAADLHDLIGIRVILLFQRDLKKTCELVAKKFHVVQSEDKSKGLGEKEFGYASVHYVVMQPETWNALPTLADTANMRAEIQIRTLAQHIWAAASHTLQYKQESSVPPPVRRSINRVAALLETVDLEFERVLDLRAGYIHETNARTTSDVLNVDLLAKVLDEILPPQNKDHPEDYASVLRELDEAGIKTAEDLRTLLKKNMAQLLAADARAVKDAPSENYLGTSKERNNKGVFWTHIGMVRVALVFSEGKF